MPGVGASAAVADDAAAWRIAAADAACFDESDDAATAWIEAFDAFERWTEPEFVAGPAGACQEWAELVEGWTD